MRRVRRADVPVREFGVRTARAEHLRALTSGRAIEITSGDLPRGQTLERERANWLRTASRAGVPVATRVAVGRLYVWLTPYREAAGPSPRWKGKPLDPAKTERLLRQV